MHIARSVLPTSALVLAMIGVAAAGGCGSVGSSSSEPATAKSKMMEVSGGTCEATAEPLSPVSAPGQSATIALGKLDDGPLAGKTLAFVADEDDKALIVVDVDSKKQISSQKLEGTPGQVMVAADGRVLVTIREKSKVSVLHAKKDGTLTMGCSVETAAEPIAMATTPDGKTLLVTSGWGKSLESFEMASFAKLAKASLPREPRSVVVDDAGKYAYVTHAVGGRVSVVELATMKPQKRLDVLVNPQVIAQQAQSDRPFSLTSSVTGAVGDENGEKPIAGRSGTRMGCQAFPMVKSTAPKGRILAPQILVDPGDPENRAAGYGDANVPTEVPAVAVIDTGTRAFVPAAFGVSSDRFFARDPNQPEDGECLLPRGAAVDDDSSTLLVTCLGIDAVVAYDAASANPVSVEKARWDVGSGPTGVAVDREHHRAIVFSQFERSIEIVDLATMGSKESTKSTGRERVALDAMAKPMPLAYVLGRQIFHSTGDARISRDGRACASCHPDGRDDAITWATPDGPRRSIMLAGRLTGTEPFSWNGSNKDVREHLSHTFDRLNGQGLRNVELEALLTFVSAMPAPPREVEADAKLVKQGDALFHSEKTACGSCHTEGGTDSRNHDLGSKAKADRKAAFNTPSLSYLSGRGPFFHDGRYDNLRDLLVQSDGMMGHTKGLDEKELGALEAYLNSL